MNIKYERRFKLWFYTVSHAQAIYRCVKDDAHETQVDLLFKDVHFINTPTSLDGVEIIEADPNAAMAACGEHGIPGNRKARLFHLQGRGWSGYIIAGHFEHAQSKANFYEESSLLVEPYLGRAKERSFRRFGNLIESIMAALRRSTKSL